MFSVFHTFQEFGIVVDIANDFDFRLFTRHFMVTGARTRLHASRWKEMAVRVGFGLRDPTDSKQPIENTISGVVCVCWVGEKADDKHLSSQLCAEDLRNN